MKEHKMLMILDTNQVGGKELRWIQQAASEQLFHKRKYNFFFHISSFKTNAILKR